MAGTILLGTQGCQRQNWDTNPEHMLRLSTDTLFFDTVFATVGSVTLPLKLYNDHDASLRVEDLQLADGSSSAYRLNVNGRPVQDLDTPLETLSLLPGDSMYVFVEVTVDPNSGAGATPFWVRDELTFVTNGNVQEVKLLARGQNAVFHGGPNQYTTLACDEVWTAELPHVIYGRILVDPGCTLTILPGAEVYAHDGSGIWVREEPWWQMARWGHPSCSAATVWKTTTPPHQGNGDSLLKSPTRFLEVWSISQHFAEGFGWTGR